MALLTAHTPTKTGTTWSPAAVAASDTISAADLGTLGAFLVVFNGGGSSDTVAISDSGLTPAGSTGASTGGAVANATSKSFYISPKQVNFSTGLVTVTHSFTTSVTCILLPIG
jgi:hypothetical protein